MFLLTHLLAFRSVGFVKYVSALDADADRRRHCERTETQCEEKDGCKQLKRAGWRITVHLHAHRAGAKNQQGHGQWQHQQRQQHAAPTHADGQRGALTAAQFDKAKLAAGNAEKSFGEAIKRGVKVAFGTDTGVSPHGRNAEEFALMVKNGMSPALAIRSATVDAAELLGVSARLGTITAGKEADIIAVAGDPTSDVRLLENVGFVMKRGKLIKLDGKPQLTAAD